MKVIGLVGGIGSGKSEVAKILASLGAEVIDADKVGHHVYEPGTPGFDAVVAEYGREIVADDGRIDRKLLGARVFGDPAALQRLNEIVHPLIREEIAKRIETARTVQKAPVAFVEAAIMLEAGWRPIAQEIWAVIASPELVRDRLQTHRGLSVQDIEARVARQTSDDVRRSAADVVIENRGTLQELRDRVEELWRARIAR